MWQRKRRKSPTNGGQGQSADISSQGNFPPKTELQAKEKVIELLAMRDHSRRELAQKLLKKKFSADLIESALIWAEERNLLRPAEELSAIMARHLSAKNKGLHYINNYLRTKGLPPVKADSDDEIEKARKIAQQYLKKNATLDRETRAKIGRRLLARGFDAATVRKVLNERFE